MADTPISASLVEWHARFNSCLMEAGQSPAQAAALQPGDWLVFWGPQTEEWADAAHQALRLTGPTFPPAAKLLKYIEMAPAMPKKWLMWSPSIPPPVWLATGVEAETVQQVGGLK